MARNFSDWLTAYLDFSSHAEAGRGIRFWAAVSAVAGALRRKVWFDQIEFQWYPSFYIVFVGPPSVLTKSTTAGGPMRLLREVPGINFGPDAATWQKLAVTMANCGESYEYKGEYLPMAALTLVSGELGSLIDFKQEGLVPFLIELWDGKPHYEKQTKGSGTDYIAGPWINILGCTTPQWITANMNATTIAGGFTSRCIFVYGDKKENPIAYLKNRVQTNHSETKRKLVQDLEHIATTMCGEYSITPEAEKWGEAWYENIWKVEYRPENPDWLNGYIGRKQAHLHKLAIVLAAAKRDELVLELEDLQLADIMLRSIEPDMHKVFSCVGKTEESIQVSRLIEIVKRRGEISFEELYRTVHAYFPQAKNFEDIFAGTVRAGILSSYVKGGRTLMVKYEESKDGHVTTS